MSKLSGILVLGALLAAVPAFAQQPAAGTAAPTPPPGSVVATTNNPNLAVASIRLENGTRLSRVIGASVYNATDKIGAVDDLVMTAGDKVTMAIISVGGFLGVGGKLVAVPWSDLHADGDKMVLPGASKDSLNGMPNFQY